MSFLGTLPVVLFTRFGNFYRPHHIITNCAVVPAIIAFMALHLRKFDDRYKTLEYVNSNELFKKRISALGEIALYLGELYVYAFMNMYEIYEGETLVRMLNAIFLIIAIYGFVMGCTVWILNWFALSKIKADNEIGLDVFPYEMHIAIIYFYVAWGLMAFYNTEHRLESLFYGTAMIFILLSTIVIVVLFRSIQNAVLQAGKFCKILASNAFLAIYTIIVKCMENSEFTHAEQSIPVYTSYTAIVLAVIFFLVLVALMGISLYRQYKDKD